MAVHTLRHDRRPFLLTVTTVDLSRTYSVRGDSVVADASGAAVMLVSDLTVEAARVERLSTDAVDADDSLAAYQLTEISVGTGLQLWGLGEAMLRANPRMGEVLEQLRQDRRLPEYADFPAFKNEQLRLFTTQIEPVEEMVHLSDGTTLRSVAIPHPFGGLWGDATDTLALERNYNKLIAVQRETLDNLFEGVAVIGANGRLRLSNPAFGSMWQIPAHESHISEIVNHISDLIGDSDAMHADKQQLIGVLTDRKSHSGRMERIDGGALDYATVPLPDGAVLLRFLDVSVAINMERALRERNEALETADRLKSEFIANGSYELRTPLNPIIGFTEILGGEYFGDLNDRQAEYTTGILASSNRLLLLINDILDLATIEAGHMSLERDSIDINGLLNSVLGLVHERARQKKLTIECNYPPNIGAMVVDEKRLKQALFNILSNTVKFTPHDGEIIVSARRQGDEIILTTSDGGVGISSVDQDRVFAKFERGTSAEARRSGAGLGLSLVKSFVEMHGGKVALESESEVGTSVISALPSRAAPSAPLPDLITQPKLRSFAGCCGIRVPPVQATIEMANDNTATVTLKLADIAAMERLAGSLAAILEPGDVVGLSGDLGTGKTVFARASIQALAATHDVPVDDIPSPTFTLVQQYDFPAFSLFHIDLYRIDQPVEVLELGVEDFFADGVSLIEWPERLGPYLPADRLHLTLRPGDHEHARTVEVEKCGAWKTRDLEFPDNG